MSTTPKPAAGQFVTCETMAANIVHIRRADRLGPNYHGHSPRPTTLCNAPAAWDTRIPLTAATCRVCVSTYAKTEHHENA